MTPLTLVQSNGHKPTNGTMPPSPSQSSPSPQANWLQQPTRQFFSRINWDDYPPAVQQLRQERRQAARNGVSVEPLSLTLSVSQFFSAVNWDNSAIASSSTPTLTIEASASNAFTLDEFSDLF